MRSAITCVRTALFFSLTTFTFFPLFRVCLSHSRSLCVCCLCWTVQSCLPVQRGPHGPFIWVQRPPFLTQMNVFFLFCERAGMAVTSLGTEEKQTKPPTPLRKLAQAPPIGHKHYTESGAQIASKAKHSSFSCTKRSVWLAHRAALSGDVPSKWHTPLLVGYCCGLSTPSQNKRVRIPLKLSIIPLCLLFFEWSITLPIWFICHSVLSIQRQFLQFSSAANSLPDRNRCTKTNYTGRRQE